MIRIVSVAQRSQMKTRPANIRLGPATSFATSESGRPQKEQRKTLPNIRHLTDPIETVGAYSNVRHRVGKRKRRRVTQARALRAGLAISRRGTPILQYEEREVILRGGAGF